MNQDLRQKQKISNITLGTEVVTGYLPLKSKKFVRPHTIKEFCEQTKEIIRILRDTLPINKG